MTCTAPAPPPSQPRQVAVRRRGLALGRVAHSLSEYRHASTCPPTPSRASFLMRTVRPPRCSWHTHHRGQGMLVGERNDRFKYRRAVRKGRISPRHCLLALFVAIVMTPSIAFAGPPQRTDVVTASPTSSPTPGVSPSPTATATATPSPSLTPSTVPSRIRIGIDDTCLLLPPPPGCPGAQPSTMSPARQTSGEGRGGSRAELPRTGSDMEAALTVGLILILLGALALTVATRRHQRLQR